MYVRVLARAHHTLAMTTHCKRRHHRCTTTTTTTSTTVLTVAATTTTTAAAAAATITTTSSSAAAPRLRPPLSPQRRTRQHKCEVRNVFTPASSRRSVQLTLVESSNFLPRRGRHASGVGQDRKSFGTHLHNLNDLRGSAVGGCVGRAYEGVGHTASAQQCIPARVISAFALQCVIDCVGRWPHSECTAMHSCARHQCVCTSVRD
jgi:hypothetical protein